MTPQGFDGAMQAGESPDVSVPLAHYLRFQPDRAARAQPWYWWIRIMGRLAPGATPAQARASLEPIFQETAREGWLAGRSRRPRDRRADARRPDARRRPGRAGRERHAAAVREAAAHADGARQPRAGRRVRQRREPAARARRRAARGRSRLRLALGASRGRIVRQLLAESLLLALAGAALGTALAWWSRDLLLALRPFGNTAVVLDLPLDARVLGFTIAVTVATALLFGLAPALRATRVDLSAQFQGGTRTLGSGGRSRLSQALMVVQIALSLVLLVSTGLFVRTLGNLQDVDAGFNRHGLVLFRIDATSAGYTPRAVRGAAGPHPGAVCARLPGVRAATFSSVAAALARAPEQDGSPCPAYVPPAGASPIVNTNGVAPNFFSAMELPLVLGRGFTDRDDADRAAGRRRQPGVRAHVLRRREPRRARRSASGRRQPIRSRSWASPATRSTPSCAARRRRPSTFRRSSALDGDANFAVRLAGTGARPDGDGRVFRRSGRCVREIDPTLPVLNLRTQDEQIDRLHAQELLFARLSGFFGVLALALACVGLYGLMSYAVLRRTGEIGLRMALGAPRLQVLRMILRESLTLVCLGVVAGAAGAYASGRLVATMLFGVSATDPLTYGSLAIALLVIAALASLLPALRASRIDPLVALKAE